MRRALTAALVLVALVGCGEEVAPGTFVDKFRVLSVQASPPDLAPGETSVLTALAVDPTRPGKKNTLVWLACDPDPQDLTRSSCSDVSTLSDPGAFTGSELPPGVRAIGFGDLAAYQAPKETFASLDASNPIRVQGAVAQILVIAIAAELSGIPTAEQRDALFEKVKSKEIASVLAIFRIRVTEDPQRNRNPTLSSLDVDGTPLPEGATVRFRPDRATPFSLSSPDADFETYTQLTPDGEQQKTERIIAALYSTTGRFEQERLEVGSGTAQSFEPPTGKKTDPKPDDRRGTLWVVLRDTRGGQSPYTFPFFLCDPSLAAPEVTGLSPTNGPANGSQRVTFSGRNVSSILDITVGGKAVLDARYDADRDVFEGTVPTLDAGDHEVVVRGKHCADASSAITYRSP